MKRKVITALIVIAVTLGLTWIARILVNSFNIVEFLKRIHGG
jgi:hypothetical protein